MQEELLYTVWLSLCAPTASPLIPFLLKFFGSAEKVYEASEEDLFSCPLEWSGQQRPFLNKDLRPARRILDDCEKWGVQILTPQSTRYPKRLFDLKDPPQVLYCLGEFCDLDAETTVAVVGSRTPSDYGVRAAKRLSLDLAKSGAVLVSGLARGIDSVAHRAALYAGTFTVAVLGCGIDRVYPPEHRDLYAKIRENGLIITEYPPSTPPHAHNFPQRNRIIAALSRATLVVEASSASGSLITARLARELHRDVWAVPSAIFSSSGLGTNELLFGGARCALRAEDIMVSLAPSGTLHIPRLRKKRAEQIEKHKNFRYAPTLQESERPRPKVVPREKADTLTDRERAVLGLLSDVPQSVDALSAGPLGAGEVLGLLSSLELKGYVCRTSGGRFRLTDEEEGR